MYHYQDVMVAVSESVMKNCLKCPNHRRRVSPVSLIRFFLVLCSLQCRLYFRVANVVAAHHLHLPQYAGDTQLYVAVRPIPTSRHPENCNHFSLRQ